MRFAGAFGASLVHARGPIPGTKRVKYVEENAAAADVTLTDEQLAAIDAALPAGAVAVERYPAECMGSVEL